MNVIVVIPTYNERENLVELCDRIFALAIDGLRVLIVDDNSPDGTAQLAMSMGRGGSYNGKIDVLQRPGKLGLGTAYVEGFQYALNEGADMIVQMDADLSHPPEYISGLLTVLEDCDVAIGSRYTKGGTVDPSWGLRRKILSRAGNTYARWVTGLTIKDATGGFRCFTRYALEAIDLQGIRSEGFAFQLEMAYRSHRNGLRIAELPIHFPNRILGGSKMSWRIILEAFVQVLHMKFRKY